MDRFEPAPLTDRTRQWVTSLELASGSYAARSWPGETVVHAGLALAEEAGEVCKALLKREHGTRGTFGEWTQQVRKECGDVFLVLCDIAHREGFSLAQAVMDRYEEIIDRDLNHDPL
jgi:NTP pyrophosphatase (non-canonical NTP hydrolase)